MPKTGKFATSSEIEEIIKAFSQIRNFKVRKALLRAVKAIAMSESMTEER